MTKEHTDTMYKFVSRAQNPEAKSNIRPEVLVTIHKDALIKDIKHEEGSSVAKVFLELPKLTVKLKYDIYAWILTDSDAFKMCQAALQDGSLHTIRVETQRVKKISAEIPILELNTKALASESVRSIIAAVDNSFTSEALTDPQDDFKEAGGVKPYDPNAQSPVVAPQNVAQGGPVVNADSIMQAIAESIKSREVRASIIDVLAAQALMAGVSAADVNAAISGTDKRAHQAYQPREIIAGRPASIEAPTWNAYNSDGRYNIGQQKVGGSLDNSAQIYAVFADKEMTGAENRDEIAMLFGHAYMAIADQVQLSLYGAGWRPDRAATSHQKIRSLVRSVIAHEYELPIELDDSGDILITGGEEGLNLWTIIVGKTVVTRYRNAIEVAESDYKIKSLPYPGKEDSQVAPENHPQAPARDSRPAPHETHNEAPTAPPAAAQDTEDHNIPDSYADGPSSDNDDDDYPENHNTTSSPEVTQTAPNEVHSKNNGSAEERHEMMKNLLQQTGSYRTEDNIERREKVTNAPVFVEDPDNAPKGLKAPELIDAEYAETAEYSGSEESQQLKELLEKVGYNVEDEESLKKISLLLAYTFGPNHAKVPHIPKKEFYGFFDHYSAVGKDAFIQSIEYVNKIHQK